MRRGLLSILMLLSLSGILFAQTTISVGGFIKGKSMTSLVDKLLTVSYSNGGGSVITTGYAPTIPGQGYVNNTLPYGWYGVIKPSHIGFVFTPPDTTIAFPLVQNLTRPINFTVIDTMKPKLYFIGKIPTMYINSTDSIRTTVYDNCQMVRKYVYDLSYDKGSTWALICSTIATYKYNSYSFSANDTSYWYCKKAQAFTPTIASDSCQIKVTVYDIEDNFTTIISPTFSVVDPVPVIKQSKQVQIRTAQKQGLYDACGRSMQNKKVQKIKTLILFK